MPSASGSEEQSKGGSDILMVLSKVLCRCEARQQSGSEVDCGVREQGEYLIDKGAGFSNHVMMGNDKVLYVLDV